MEYVFKVSGMSCGHCERAITQALHKADPRSQVHIDRGAQLVRVLSEQAGADLAQAIREEGYGVDPAAQR